MPGGRSRVVAPGAGIGVGAKTGDLPGEFGNRNQPPTPIQSFPQPSPTLHTDTFIPVKDPVPVFYGPFRTGGQLIADIRTSSGGKLCSWIVCLGQINAFTSLTVGNKDLTTFWGATVHTYLGTSSQTADSLLAAAYAAGRLAQFGAGIEPKTGVALAYVVAQFQAPSATIPDPDPYQFLAEGQGMLVSDPSLGVNATTNIPSAAKVYSDNPILCRADWRAASSGAYGFRQPVSSIDWSGSVLASAAACNVDIGGGTKRFTLSAQITTAGDPHQEDENMRATCQGLAAVYNNGLWQFPIDLAQASSGFLLTDHGVDHNLNSIGPLATASPSQVKTRVKVTYTDVAHGFKPDTTPADDDPGIAGGTVPIEDVTESIQYCPTYDQAVRLGKYRRKRYAMDKSFPFETMPDGIQLLPGVRFSCTSTALNLSNADCICTDIAPSPSKPGVWVGRTEFYDANVYDDTKATATAFSPPAVQSPYDAPPTPIAPTLTQEGFDVRIDFVRPSSPVYQFYGGMRITIQKAGLTAVDTREVMDGPLYIKGVTMGTLYTVKAYVLSSVVVGLVGLAATSTITPAMAQIPPEVINTGGYTLGVASSRPSGAAALYFDKPVDRSATLYGAGALTATNLHSYTAAKVNDGDTSLACFDWNVSGASRLAFNLGSAKTIAELWVYTSAFAADPNIQVSDDGTTWSGFSGNPVTVASMGGGITLRIYLSPGGSHQYIAVTKATTNAEATTFTEVWPREYGAASSNIDHYNIYGISTSDLLPWSGTRQLFNTVPYGSEPTSANPLDVNAIAYHNPNSYPPPWGIGGNSYLNVIVTTVSTSGVESFGVGVAKGSTFTAVGSGPYLDQLTLQGADLASASTVNIGAGTGRNVNITGTTTITAFDTIAAGVERVLKFAGILTLTHNGTSLILPGAANIVTGAGDEATFLSLGSGNWRCTGYMRAAIAPPVGPWVSFTPTVTPSVGTWTAPTYNTAKYRLDGKTLDLVICASGTISNNSTLAITLPLGLSSNMLANFVGRNLIANAVLVAETNSGTTLVIYNDMLAGNWPAGSGVNFRVSARFEVQ